MRSIHTARRLASFAGPCVATLRDQPDGRYVASAASGTCRSSWKRASELNSTRVWAAAGCTVANTAPATNNNSANRRQERARMHPPYAVAKAPRGRRYRVQPLGPGWIAWFAYSLTATATRGYMAKKSILVALSLAASVAWPARDARAGEVSRRDDAYHFAQ